MATSKTQICNLALSKIGEERIQDIDESGSENARVCKLHYEGALRSLLRMAPWGFATTRAQLTRSTTAPAFGWSYQFPLPTNYIQVLEANDVDLSLYEPEDFVIEDGHVLSDATTCKIRYVYFNDNAATFPEDFVEALSCWLGSKIAVPLTGNPGLKGQLLEEFEALQKPRASRQNGNESRDKRRYKPFESDLVRARYIRGPQ